MLIFLSCIIADIDLVNFFLQPSVFSKCVKQDRLQLSSEGVYVVWKWDICTDSEGVSASESEELDTSKEVESENDKKEIESESDDETAAAIPVTHTVTFKCIGATKTPE